MTRRTASPASTPHPLTGARLAEALIAGWRPLQRLEVGGFALLRSRGITRRAHSIVALDPPTSPDELAAALAQVESLVTMAGERPTHRIFDGAHSALDELLAARGDAIVGRSEVWQLPLTGTLPRPHASAMIATGTLDEGWFEAAWRLAPRDGVAARETLRHILSGTPAIQVRLSTQDGATVAAVGRAALVKDGKETLVVLNMIAVDPERRRQGLARAVSETLLALAAVQGARRALLEVEADNAPALALYRGLGFRRISGYHYRVNTA